ncbi:SDR family NAD(P)-dependent oxidoreductase [Novosphingobium sp. KN65.2]|uniref:SDR family NAD(P)-dependent oxidoreductase n=1 Tax=Novosphingobium sp. KN65.2 TaxID=1478134 RepID=UPI0005DB26D5|nr:SDR family oxidoreductase [Novosphingobium sp. KN65.2]CDO38635.1 Short-chain dehydrogenase/reductase SDR [Novosphingobium sp. KN65.2]
MTQRRFEGRSVFITGAGNGIGLATARAFASEGANVAIAEVDQSRGEAAAENIRAAGGNALFVACDAVDEASVRAAIIAACDAYGPIRHAFNNVGAPQGSRIEETTLEQWEWTFRMNLTSTFLAMKHEIPVMRSGGGGTIVNCASNTASVYTAAAPIAYTAAKAAVINLSHHASIELGKDRIRVNSISPGLTATPLVLDNLPPDLQGQVTAAMQVVPRLAKPEEMAGAVLYLSSDEAEMIVGENLEVGGGRLF